MLLCSNEWTIEVEYLVLQINQPCKAKGFRDLKVGDTIRVTYIKIPSRTGDYTLYSKCHVFDMVNNVKYIRTVSCVDKYLECFATKAYVVDEKFSKG